MFLQNVHYILLFEKKWNKKKEENSHFVSIFLPFQSKRKKHTQLGPSACGIFVFLCLININVDLNELKKR